MTSLVDVRKAVINRLQPVRDVEYLWYVPAYPELPVVWVTPDFPFVDYEQAFSSSYATWGLLLTFAVDRIDEEAAQTTLSEWLDPDGPFIGALRDECIDDELSRLSTDIRVTSGGDFNEMLVGETMCYYAQIRVSIKA
jgi:hypothetical protein